LATLSTSWLSNRSTKWILGAAALAVLLYLAIAPRALPVYTEAIFRGQMEVTVSAEGRTRIRDIYTLSAPVSGRVLRIDFDAGDEVFANETIVAIFEPVEPGFLDERSLAQARARLNQAKAAVVRARAERSYAATEWERVRAMEVGRTVTQKTLDQARSNRDATAAAYEAILAEQQAAEAALIAPSGKAKPHDETDTGCCLSLTSPINGRILRITEKSERVMTAGSTIMEIGQPEALEIVVDLLSQDAVKVEAGARAYLENWGGEAPLLARVQRVEPSGFTKISALGVEEQRVNVILDLDDPGGWRGLQDAYRVEPRIVVWQQESALQVPLGALFRAGDEWAVFVRDGNQAEQRLVRVGQRNRTTAQVLDGLAEGEEVILHPSEHLSHGSRVSLRQ
jgi:HlyD family secretion protein